MKILAADYVLPISSEPISSGAVGIEAERIVAVGTRSELTKQFPEAAGEDFGEAAILPGFVNCHSHLEITAMRGALDQIEHDFYTWLITLTKTRSEVLSDEDIEIAAVAGALEGARAGVTCFGDIGRYGKAGLEALKKTCLRGVLFQETEFSPEDRTAAEDFEKFKYKFLALRAQQTDLVEVGLSPHAPYTVSRSLFERLGRYAVDEGIKVTIHAAESKEEDHLLRFGEGFFTTVYEKFGVKWESPLCSSVEFLSQTGILEAKPLLAHCITVSESDIDLIAASGSQIAHCPKSNTKFGHGYAPFERFLDEGIAVGIGSDSVASNNVCDMLEESRFAVLAARNREGRKRFITAKEAIETATLGGAKALGLSGEIGTLKPGKQADIAVISLAGIAQQPVNDIYSTLIFSSNAQDIVSTIVAGKEIYRDGKSTVGDEIGIRARMKEIGKRLKKV